MIDTRYRSTDSEMMDDLDMSGDQLINALDQLANINRFLGGNALTLDGIKKMLNKNQEHQKIKVVDYGCGHGDMLRKIADFGRKNDYKFDLIGIDANQTAIQYGKDLSTDYPEISYIQKNILSDEPIVEDYDIALCTLFLHHFEDEVIESIVKSLLRNAQMGVVINDLHRHAIAYYLFKSLSLFIKNEMVIEDGLTSILKGFKRSDIEKFSESIDYENTINWRWAFRWQWLIFK